MAIPVFALVLLTGCETNVTGSYPADLSYPARTDPIVTEVPGDERFYADQPGTIEHVVERIGPKEDGGLGGKALLPANAAPEKRQELAAELRTIFGSPAAPSVNVGDDEEAKGFAKELNLGSDTLAAGSQLYRRHCLTCHGVAGDGRGPTGPWVNPHPRDYRLGAFKFISTDPDKISDNAARKPRRADLIRTLTVGVDGTTMPSFSLLPADQLEQLVSYIIHLSLRGEVEIETLKPLIISKDKPDLLNAEGEVNPAATIATHVRFLTKLFLNRWSDSNGAMMEPAPYPFATENERERLESVRRGYELFTNSSAEDHPKVLKGAGCISCHQDFGRQVNFKYDQWGSLVRPANLTLGVYRGGRRPVDLYWRVRGGIIPSQMPLVKLMKPNPDGTDSDEIEGKKYWDLVNFIQALPYPEMLPKEVRNKVYPPVQETVESQQHAAR
jgi:mono/diheme cytochrome c family protein